MMCFYDYGCRLFQGVDILNQGVTVIVGFRLGEGVIRDNAFVNIIEGTVQHCCQLFGTGNREHRAGSGCAGQYYAGAAAGAPPEQCDGASRPERGRNEIATGEGIAGDQTVQVITLPIAIRQQIKLFFNTVSKTTAIMDRPCVYTGIRAGKTSFLIPCSV